jgi:hypothetical protein
MERFVQRTWRKTSEKICRANDIPPGFRIVLLDEYGRVKRDDLLVRSGSFGAYPGSFRIWAFLEEAIKNHVKDPDCLDYDEAELRDHRDNLVGPDLTLIEVRDMPGAGGRHTKAWSDDRDAVLELEYEIKDALAIFDADDRVANDPSNTLLLKALMQHIISQFHTGQLDYVLNFYKEEIERKRSKGR